MSGDRTCRVYLRNCRKASKVGQSENEDRKELSPEDWGLPT